MRPISKRNNRPIAPIPPPPPPSTSSTESSYAVTLTRVAVAQICNSIGFASAETPALRILSDIAARYLRSIAKSAADSANSAGRTQSNIVDTVAGVEELSSVTGFAGAWRVSTGGTFLNSGAVKELARFSDYSEEIPFAKSLPRKIFKVDRGKGLRNIGINNNEYIGGERKHIPKWLPVMPVIETEEEKKKRKDIWGLFCGEIEETTTTTQPVKSFVESGEDGETTTTYAVKSNKVGSGNNRVYTHVTCKTEERHRELKKEENGRERKGIELPLKRGGRVRFKIGGVRGV
ncbi:uncharacterized protein LOC132041194 [Lycium ferocissimum]|uniref:uncharacterized protein LOC132041194 n=1 Tax=Lycium ferocissimum TaxID=112874 RepID=UPI002814B594|nr:uncharacterized protein LOC132041194 [Lycium ferocissimum]